MATEGKSEKRSKEGGENGPGPGPPAPPGPHCDIFRSAKLRLASQKMISVRAGGAGGPTVPDGVMNSACRSPHPLNDRDERTKAGQ